MIRTSVTHEELEAAIKPLCDLLGTNWKNYFATPGLTLSERAITFTVPVCHEEDPSGRARSMRRHSLAETLPPHPQGFADVEPVIVGEDYAAELGYAITVEVEVR